MNRKTVKELIEIAYECGLAENQMFKRSGGPVRKEILIANIIAKLEQYQ